MTNQKLYAGAKAARDPHPHRGSPRRPSRRNSRLPALIFNQMENNIGRFDGRFGPCARRRVRALDRDRAEPPAAHERSISDPRKRFRRPRVRRPAAALPICGFVRIHAPMLARAFLDFHRAYRAEL